jgi:hypothetical protein
MEVLNVKITERTLKPKCPFSEIFITFERDGVERVAYSRVPYLLSNAPHTRAAQAQEFLRRQRISGAVAEKKSPLFHIAE